MAQVSPTSANVDDKTLLILAGGVGLLAFYAIKKGSDIVGGIGQGIHDTAGAIGQGIHDTAGAIGQGINDAAHTVNTYPARAADFVVNPLTTDAATGAPQAKHLPGFAPFPIAGPIIDWGIDALNANARSQYAQAHPRIIDVHDLYAQARNDTYTARRLVNYDPNGAHTGF